MSHPHTSLRSGIVSLGAALLALSTAQHAHAQGCVVARGAGHCAVMPHSEDGSPWELSTSYRWFQSDRHFVGTTEQVHRQEEGSQVINRSHFVDLGITYNATPRYSFSLTLPFVSHDRSSVVRDQNRVILQRYHVQSAGLADIQIGGAGWVFDPANPHRGNLQLGLGLVLPTGEKDARDTFQAFDATTQQIIAVERTVDQSIQPGSGGYGINLNAYGYRELGAGLTGFASASYTITPQENNGVPTYRGSAYEQIMSIPDSYLARTGVEFLVSPASGVSLSLAARIEGVMVHDLVGGSSDFRRPGYSIAIEPGISITRAKWSARLYVPFAVQRNRQQSVPDKQESAATGTYKQGDAAFADFLIAASISYRL